MKISLKTLVIALLSVFCLVALSVDRAVGVDLDLPLPQVKGKIIAADRIEKTIEVRPDSAGDNVLIKGFPFDYLERVLSDWDNSCDVTIAVDDCVTVVYIEEDKDKKVINRAVELTRYSYECGNVCDVVYDCENKCYDVSVDPANYNDSVGILIVEIQDDGSTFPVNKNPEEDDPGESHQKGSGNR